MSKKCSFCNSEATEDNEIIGTENNYICKACAETALCLLDSGVAKEVKDGEDVEIKQDKKVENISPNNFKKILDEYVVGQDSAKKVISIGVYNHLLRIQNLDKKVNKSNIMMIGPTGTGKTFLAETIAKKLDIPLAIVNTTSLTAAGYIGEDVSSVLERLWKDAGEDVEKAEKGIIFLDEIDKNATSGGGTNNKDVSGKAVQQELLKLLEGDKVNIYTEGNSNNRKSGSPVEIDTTNILFIAGGAFVGLKDKPGVQVNALGSSSFDNSVENIVLQDMIKDYGLISEFIGRFPTIVELEELDLSTMKKILQEPKDNLLEQYKTLFKLSDVEVDFEDNFIETVANKALNVSTGARGLSTIMEELLSDVMFNISQYKNKAINIDYKDKLEVISINSK